MKGVSATEELPAGVRLSTELLARLRKARAEVLPNGPADIERDGRVIFVALGGRVPLGECERFVAWAKPLAAITYDPTGDVMRDAFGNWLGGYFNEWWCAAYSFVAAFKIDQMLAGPEEPAVLTGGDGESEERALVVRSSSTRQALSAVYAYLGREMGPANTWCISRRITLKYPEGSSERFDLATDSGLARTLHFRIVRAEASVAGAVVQH